MLIQDHLQNMYGTEQCVEDMYTYMLLHRMFLVIVVVLGGDL